jgi:hypothetical protein
MHLFNVLLFVSILSGIVGIVRYRKCSKRYPDDLVPNSDFPVLHSLVIGLSVAGISSDHFRKYMTKI